MNKVKVLQLLIMLVRRVLRRQTLRSVQQEVVMVLISEVVIVHGF